MNYNLTQSSTKITSTHHFNYNPELKSFVESYLQNKPNLEIVKITDPNCIKDVERVLQLNENLTESSYPKRQRIEGNRIGVKQTPSSSRLLNALSGNRLSNVTLNRINSPSINTSNRKHVYHK